MISLKAVIDKTAEGISSYISSQIESKVHKLLFPGCKEG